MDRSAVWSLNPPPADRVGGTLRSIACGVSFQLVLAREFHRIVDVSYRPFDRHESTIRVYSAPRRIKPKSLSTYWTRNVLTLGTLVRFIAGDASC